MSLPRLLRFVCVTALLGFSAGIVNATVIGITNGDFESQIVAGTDAADQFVTSWFESATPAELSGYQDWVFDVTSGATFDPVVGAPTTGNTTNVVGFSTNAGYIYQQIGTYSVNEEVTITGRALKRNVSSSAFNGFTVELLAGNFTPASDTTPLTATLLDSESYTAADLGLPTGSTNNSGDQPFTAFFEASNNTSLAGQQLWLRIRRPVANGEIFLDNLAATGVIIPEPSSLVILAFGGVASVFIRRHKLARSNRKHRRYSQIQ